MTETLEFRVRLGDIERNGYITLRQEASLDYLKKRLLRKLNYLTSNITHITLYLTIGIGK
jgi:hypothetical protein